MTRLQSSLWKTNRENGPMDEQLAGELLFNGINAETGDYLFPKLTLRQAA